MIPNHILKVGVILSLSKPSIHASNANSRNYVGAVVEYHPVTEGDDGLMIAEANANNYRTIIKTASAYKTDIIIFPEFGLTSLPRDGNREIELNATEYRDYYRDTASYVPNPNETVILCDSDSKYAKSLRSVSCAAREFGIYVVANHHEKVDCPKSMGCDFLLYSTNVVFDRKGHLIARYRRSKRLNETGLNVLEEPEISTFQTDFGVTFGQFISFDILQEEPANHFANNLNVTDVVYTSRWFDELPFLGSVQAQAAWAYGADVNFLAAGYSDASTNSGGSGIYAGKNGRLAVYNPGRTFNAIVVAEIPKAGRRPIPDEIAEKAVIHVFKQAEVPTVSGPGTPGIRGLFRDDLRAYTSVLLDPTQGSHITTLCDRGLCCDFHVETTFDKVLADKPGVKQYRHRLVVFNGVRKFGNDTTMGLEICSLVTCTSEAIEDCGSLYPIGTNVGLTTRFNSLIITRRADLEQRVFYAPTTLANDLDPMPGSDFAYLASGRKNSSLLIMYLIRPRRTLLTFGIHGRRYDKDGDKASEPVSASVRIEPTVLMIIGLIVILHRW